MGLFQNAMNLIFEGKENLENKQPPLPPIWKYPVQFLKILVDGSAPLTPFRLIPAPRCRGGQFFWQLQLFGRRVLPAPPIGGCQPSRGEAERWASPINEGDKLTTNLGKEWQENHRETQEELRYIVDHSGPVTNQERPDVHGI